MGVLAWRGHPHCAWPVVVHVRQLVADLLQDVSFQACVVVDHYVVGRGHRALWVSSREKSSANDRFRKSRKLTSNLSNMLRDQEEGEPVPLGDRVVQH